MHVLSAGLEAILALWFLQQKKRSCPCCRLDQQALSCADGFPVLSIIFNYEDTQDQIKIVLS